MASPTLELRRAMKSVGGRKKFAEQANQYRCDSEYLEKNREKLLQQHPDQWIAVYKGKVQAADENAENLIKVIEGKQVSPNEAVISFLSTRETVTLF